MTRFLAIAVTLFSAKVAVCAALVTHHMDANLYPATPDGIISANEYGSGNAHAFTGGGSGFGGQFGNATVFMKAGPNHLYIAFSNLGVPGDGNQYILYLHTRAGGFQPDGLEMDDTADDGRRNASILSLNGTEFVTFDEGAARRPDYALVFNNRDPGGDGFSALFELAGAGNTHGLIPHERAGLGTSVVEFRIPLDDLGLAHGDSVDFSGFNISGTGFLSNEGIPATGLGANPGFADGQTNIFADFHRFAIPATGPQVGLNERAANITLTLPQNPPSGGVGAYAVEDTLNGIHFFTPICIRSPPGETNRLFIGERNGRITVVTNLAAPVREEFLDIRFKVNLSGEGGLLGFDFHPDFASNGYFYVNFATTTNTALGSGFHVRLSRFQVSPTNNNFASPTTEVALITQFHRASNHNGGDVHFGPDGYLYVGLGDEGGGNDPYNNGQAISSNFFASIIRIDVDKRPGSLAPNPHPAIDGATTNYAVPPDNPFIGYSQFNGIAVNPDMVRTEIYAIGLRNPWRFSFDPITHELYAADVGQGAREEVNLIVKGGNYGWAYREGNIAGPKAPPPGFTNGINPILDYVHGTGTNQGRSITGGYVYRGTRFPDMTGKYFFADYVSGNIWYLTHNGTNATAFQRIGGAANIITFGVDPRDGDLLIGRIPETPLHRIVQTTSGAGAFPQTLADTGAFHDPADLTPYAGIVPYDLNVPFWSDGADKIRWFSIPDTNSVIAFDPEQPWTAPTGTVWIKHFDLMLTSGVPESVRRIETRFLVRNNSGSGGYGVTYRWGESMTDAILVPDEGLNESFVVDQGGVIVTQVWRYPSRAECLVCHRADAGFALGFNTPQLNRDFDYGDRVTNQLCALSEVGYLDADVQDTIHTLRALAHPTNEAYSIAYRARSFLQVNCAQCHLPGGGAPYSWDGRIATPLSLADILDAPLLNDQGDPDNRVIRRGNVGQSMIHTRITTLGSSRMPPLASSVIDTQSVALVAAWINELASHQTLAEWQIEHFASTNHPDAHPKADPDEDGADNETEYLTETDQTDPDEVWAMTLEIDGDTPVIRFPRVADRGFDVQASTNLLDPLSWQSLNVPGNAPIMTGSTLDEAINDTSATNLMFRYYRTRIFEH